MLCTWIPACYRLGRHRVERETRPDLIVDDTVRDKHLVDAERHGYRQRGRGEDTPADVPRERA